MHTFAFNKKKAPHQLFTVRMDAKLNLSDDYKEKAALVAKTVINQWRPDVVVTSDDITAKYLFVPYYMEKATLVEEVYQR